ncbi:MAG TPA: S8 family serine peptidase [Sulfurovum sp.]|jgi:subtilisin-like proprotein convertase family protein|nr:S8 family serine peptidase [Sulfurovum sp.]HQS78596.1 S8 family serine peptidase [Sulfurovum sp.]HQT28450.1 S8 family serine peptidase [Sulfurovum sp.]
MKSNLFLLIFVIIIGLLNGCGGGSSSNSTEPIIGQLPTDNIDVPSIEPPVEPDIQIPIFITENTLLVRENTVIATSVQADDDSSVSYSISGTDSLLFIIDSRLGTLKFKTAPNFESPLDNNQDNIYEITVTATDTANNKAVLTMYISVTDIDESSADDSDNDYISDNIEILIQSDLGESDINNNGIEDGLDTQGVYGDTFFDHLWYIRSLGTLTNESGVRSIIPNDLNLLGLYHTYMGYNYGENIIVQIVDTGVEADHEDLVANMDLSRSYDNATVGDPSGSNAHGTKVAGIMAARAFNGKGVRGIIPFAKIAGSNWLEAQRTPALEKAWLTGDGANDIAVSNNSWGSYFDTDTLYESIMELGTRTLRDGKGRVYVFAGGNDRIDGGNANLQYALSNRYAIAVAGLKHDNTYADYSTPGSNILVSGYSGNYYQDSPTLGSTTIMGTSSNTGNIDTQTTWDEDVQENYTFTTNGTSAASPTVAASIALVLEACPDLTYRDIKYLVAKNALQIDSSNPTWVTNAVGFKHSIDYGFGLINPQGMIDECTTTYTILPSERNASITKVFNEQIPDDRSTLSFDLNVTEDMTVEWVEVTIDNTNRFASDYRVALISPEGTKTTIMTENTSPDINNWMNGGFRLGAAALMGEKSQGLWRVEMTDLVADDAGTLRSIQLKVYGH